MKITILLLTILTLTSCGDPTYELSDKHKLRQLFNKNTKVESESWSWFLIWGSGEKSNYTHEKIRVLADFNGYKVLDINLKQVSFVFDSIYKEPMIAIKYCIEQGKFGYREFDSEYDVILSLQYGFEVPRLPEAEYIIYISEEQIPKHYQKLIFK